MDKTLLTFRASVIDGIRSFFKERDYLEVDTPLLSPSLIPESTIEIFQTCYQSEKGENMEMNLIPSPEMWMKQLLSRGAGSMFQICKCFRNREPADDVHNPEFTMLEYYTEDFDYIDSIGLTEELFRELSRAAGSDKVVSTFCRMSMEEAFYEFAGIDLGKNMDVASLAEECFRLTGASCEGDTWEQVYNRIFVTLVEPRLPLDRPVVLYDYPAAVPTLAKRKPGTPWAERWELYVQRVELANCFTEENDRERVLEFFQIEMEERKRKQMPVVSDVKYADIFTNRFPDCSGVALGVDRLIMLLAGKSTIREIIPFPFLNTCRPPL